MVDTGLEADGEQVEAHGDHDLCVLEVDERDEEAEKFANTWEAIGYVGHIDSFLENAKLIFQNIFSF